MKEYKEDKESLKFDPCEDSLYLYMVKQSSNFRQLWGDIMGIK